jgi:hypothetical protein
LGFERMFVMKKLYVEIAVHSVAAGLNHGLAMVKVPWAKGEVFCLTPIRTGRGFFTEVSAA